jgi:predicted ATPase/class 3 adenylate cyclase
MPSGDVTFAFVDVVGSTQLLHDHGESFVASLAAMHELVAECVARGGGVVVSTEGDGAFLAFPEASAAVAALCQIQQLVEAASVDTHIRLRAGAHRGHAIPVNDNYVAMPVHIAARVSGAAAAGQLLVSDSVAAAYDAPPPGWSDLGDRTLRGIASPVRLWRAAGPDTPPRAPSVKRTNVPPSRTSFIGRERTFAELTQLITQAGLVSVVGPGGLGKTRLASELVIRAAGDFERGAWLVQLSSATDEAQVVETFANALEMAGSNSDPIGSVVRELRDRGPILVVLDNCEHVIDAAASLAEALVAGVPELRLVCTSREPLELSGERIVQPGTLAIHEDGGRPGPACKLFAERAQEAGRAIDESDDEIVAELCAALDGLPLAIELAAARAAVMPLTDLAALVQARGSDGEALRRRGGDPRQQTLDGLVRWSYDLLSAGEQAAFCVLGSLPGSFTSDTAASLFRTMAGAGVAIPANAVWSLVRKSLIDLDGDRLRMLHTIRTLAEAWLHQDSTLDDAAHSALLTWAIDWIDARAEWNHDDLRPDVLAERPNLIKAVAVATRRRDPTIVRVLRRLQTVVRYGGTPPELRAAAAEMADWPTGGSPDAILCRSTAISILSGVRSGAAYSEVDQELALIAAADSTEDREVMALVRVDVASRLALPEHTALARRLLHEALVHADGLKVLERSAQSVNDQLGCVEHIIGNFDLAVAHYDRAIEGAYREHNEENVAIHLLNKAEALLDVGRATDALAAAQEGLLHVDGQQTLVAMAHALSGEAYANLGHRDEALRWLEVGRTGLLRLVVDDPTLDVYLDRVKAAESKLTTSPSLA